MPSAALCRRTALNVTSSPGLYTPRSLKTVPRSSGDASFRLNRYAEVPGLQTLVPVAPDIGDVAVLLGGDDEGELPPVVGVAQRRRRAPVARPSGPVVPVQATWLSRRTIETLAPATGSPVSSRVTKTSVLRGLSLTVIPRLVTWITDARTRLSPNGFELAIGAPFLDRGPDQPSSLRPARRFMSRPCDTMRSAAPPSRRSVPAPAGFAREPGLQIEQRRHQRAGARGAPPTGSRCGSCARRTAARRRRLLSHTPWPSPKLVNAR